MVIQSTGQISLLDIQNEFGGDNPIHLSEYYNNGIYIEDIDELPLINNEISIGNFYSKKKTPTIIIVTYNDNTFLNSEDIYEYTDLGENYKIILLKYNINKVNLIDQTEYIINFNKKTKCDILIVGGGGSGGNNYGGGGGGGAVIYCKNKEIPGGIYSIKVGNGGNINENNGKPSEAFNVIANGGGSGGKYENNNRNDIRINHPDFYTEFTNVNEKTSNDYILDNWEINTNLYWYGNESITTALTTPEIMYSRSNSFQFGSRGNTNLEIIIKMDKLYYLSKILIYGVSYFSESSSIWYNNQRNPKDIEIHGLNSNDVWIMNISNVEGLNNSGVWYNNEQNPTICMINTVGIYYKAIKILILNNWGSNTIKFKALEFYERTDISPGIDGGSGGGAPFYSSNIGNSIITDNSSTDLFSNWNGSHYIYGGDGNIGNINEGGGGGGGASSNITNIKTNGNDGILINITSSNYYWGGGGGGFSKQNYNFPFGGNGGLGGGGGSAQKVNFEEIKINNPDFYTEFTNVNQKTNTNYMLDNWEINTNLYWYGNESITTALTTPEIMYSRSNSFQFGSRGNTNLEIIIKMDKLYYLSKILIYGVSYFSESSSIWYNNQRNPKDIEIDGLNSSDVWITNISSAEGLFNSGVQQNYTLISNPTICIINTVGINYKAIKIRIANNWDSDTIKFKGLEFYEKKIISSGIGGLGGINLGNDGSNDGNGGNGGANTGGGGGAGFTNTNSVPGNGGSGIVIIKTKINN